MKRKISIGFVVVFILIVTAYLFLPLIVSNEKISVLIKEYTGEALGRTVDFETVRVSLFPRFNLEITKIDIPEIKKDIAFNNAKHALTCSVKSDSVQFSVKLLQLLFGKVAISSISFKNVIVDGALTTAIPETTAAATASERNVFFRFTDISGKLTHLNLGKPIDYDIEGNLGSEGSIIRSKGTFLLMKDDLALRSSTSETTVTNGDLELARLVCEYFGYPISFEQGTVNGVIKMKQRGRILAMENDLNVEQLVYKEMFAGKERKSIPFDASFAGGTVLDLDRALLRFDDANMILKDSVFKINGEVIGGEELAWDVTLYSRRTSLDTLPLFSRF